MLALSWLYAAVVHLGGIKPHGQTVLAILWSLQGDYLNLAEEISLPKKADVILQLPSHVRLFATLWTAALQASLSFTISWILLKLMSIESVMPSNHLSLCRPFSSCLQSFPVFSNESESFLMSQLFASGGQSIGASASASVLPMNIQD